MGVLERRVESIFEIGVRVGGVDGRGKGFRERAELLPEVDSLLIRYLCRLLVEKVRIGSETR